MSDQSYRNVMTSSWASVGIFSITTFLCVIHLVWGGRVIVASTDNLWFWEPLLELFHASIRDGELGYWNPYIAGGTGNYLNTNYTPFSLEFLFVALFPKAFILYAISITYIIHLFLIGVLSHRILLKEVPDAVWATTGAFVSQLSLPVAVALTSPAALYNVTYFLLGLYVVWTLDKRRPILSMLYLTTALSLCGLTGNLVICTWAGLVFLVLATYRVRTTHPTEGGQTTYPVRLVILAAVLASICITAIHWLPIAMSISDTARLGNVIAGTPYTLWACLVRIFAPEWLGVNYIPSFDYLVAVGAGTRHIQASAPLSYGTLTAIIVIAGLVVNRSRKTVFWAALAVVLFGIAASIEPLYSFYVLLLNPLIHPFGIEFVTPIVVGGLVAHVGASCFSATKAPGKRASVGLLLFALMLSAYMMFSWLHILNLLHSPMEAVFTANRARLVLIALSAIVALLLFALWSKKKAAVSASAFVLLAVGLSVTVAAVFFLTVGEAKNPFYDESVLLVTFRILIFSALPAVLFLFKRNDSKAEVRLLLVVAGSLIAIIGLFSYGFTRPDGVIHPALSLRGDLIVAILSLVSFWIAVMAFVVATRMLQLLEASPSAFKLMLGIAIVADLILTFHIHDRMVMNPAHSAAKVDLLPGFDIRGAGLRDQDGEALDAVNFRIGRPIAALRKIKGGIWQDMPDTLETNSPATMHISAYSGIPHLIDSQIVSFYGAFGFDRLIAGIRADFENPRFLDLLSVGYMVDDKNGQFVRRKTALGRFQLYSGWRLVASSDEALAILKDPGFDPLREVVVDGQFPAPDKSAPALSRLVPVEHGTSDNIELKVNAERPSILLFNDSFSPWWKVTLNRSEGRLLKANHSRMGIEIPSGQSTVRLTFAPPFVRWAALLAILGLLILCSAAILIYRRTRAPKPVEGVSVEGTSS